MTQCLLILYYILYGYLSLIGLSILASWIPFLYNSRIFIGIRKVCDWYMRPFRGWLVIGFLDMTPIIGIAVYEIMMRALIYLIW